MDFRDLHDPILIGLLSSTVISTVLLVVSIYCCRSIVLRNATHVVFELRRPQFVSYVIIVISVNMLLRSVIALLFYHALIPFLVFKESFRFLAIFGEVMCLIQRMYFMWYDLKQAQYKERKLLCKYLQRGNDTKQALSMMNQFAHLNANHPSPSVATHSHSASKHLSLWHRSKQSNADNHDIEKESDSATLFEKLMYNNDVFGDMMTMTMFMFLVLAIFVFIPGFFVYYVTYIFILVVFLAFILFVLYMNYHASGVNAHDPNHCINRNHTCLCLSTHPPSITNPKCDAQTQQQQHKKKQRSSTDEHVYTATDTRQTTQTHTEHNNLRQCDDYAISRELNITLTILSIALFAFLTIETLEYLLDGDFLVAFYFVLLHILLLTICAVFVVLALVFVPYFAIRTLHVKHHKGKQVAKQTQASLQSVLSHHKAFYAFTKQLVQDYSIENLMVLIEIWQYKHSPDTTHSDDTACAVESLAKMQQTLTLSDLKQPTMKHVLSGSTTSVTNMSHTTTTLAAASSVGSPNAQLDLPHTAVEEEGLSPILKLKINVLLNALQDTQSDTSEADEEEHEEHTRESQQLKSTPHPDEDEDSDTTTEPFGVKIHRSNTLSTIAAVTVHDMYSKLQDIQQHLATLSQLPWHGLPLSDSHRKYKDRYFKAVHIFNKYLSRDAFDSLNISEASLRMIECTFRSLYEYKLRSYNIGIEYDESERQQLKFVANNSSSRCSRTRTNNFDFFEEPEEESASQNRLRDVAGSVSACVTDGLGVITQASETGSYSSVPTSADTVGSVMSSDAEEEVDEDYGVRKEIRRRQKLRQTLGLEIHFSNGAQSNASVVKILTEEEFERKLDTVFDICLPDIMSNLDSALTQFRVSKEYCYVLVDEKKVE